MKNKAIFLDRDGVIIQMHYNRKHGTIDTALSLDQIEFVPHIFPFLQTAKTLGYLLIIISNQPSIGLKKLSKKNFDAMEEKIVSALHDNHITIDKAYYCFHHPFAKLKQYKMECDCKKPKTKLVETAAREWNIDLAKSWFIGDSIFDIVTGTEMGIKTILLARLQETEYLHIVEEQLGSIKPSFFVRNLTQATEILKSQSI